MDLGQGSSGGLHFPFWCLCSQGPLDATGLSHSPKGASLVSWSEKDKTFLPCPDVSMPHPLTSDGDASTDCVVLEHTAGPQKALHASPCHPFFLVSVPDWSRWASRPAGFTINSCWLEQLQVGVLVLEPHPPSSASACFLMTPSPGKHSQGGNLKYVPDETHSENLFFHKRVCPERN